MSNLFLLPKVQVTTVKIGGTNNFSTAPNNVGSDINVGIGGNIFNINSSSINNVGINNIGIGGNVFVNNTTGTNNIGIGGNVFGSNVTGKYNIGIGINSGNSILGSYNTMLGTNTGQLNTDNNVYNNSSAIGYRATINASNQIVLGTSNEKVVIPSITPSISTNSGALVVSGGVGISGETYISGNIIVNNGMNIQKAALAATNNNVTYAVNANSFSGNSAWTRLGVFTSTQEGQICIIKYYGSNGYNANIYQNAIMTIFFKTSNGNSVDANGFGGDSEYYVTGAGGTDAFQNVIWQSNVAGASAAIFTLYVLLPAFSGGGFYTVETSQQSSAVSWTPSVSFNIVPSSTVGNSTTCVAINRFYISSPFVTGNTFSATNTVTNINTVSIASMTSNTTKFPLNIGNYQPSLNGGNNSMAISGQLIMNSSQRIVWYYNWCQYATNGGSMYFFYGTYPETSTGGAYISAAGVFTNASDRKFKQNIVDLSYGLAEVLKLRPVQYQYIKCPDRTNYGFIAQEVVDILPDVVEHDTENDGLCLAYSEIISVLTKAIQEQNILIVELQNTVKQIQAQLKT